jgi:hypothetical protein
MAEPVALLTFQKAVDDLPCNQGQETRIVPGAKSDYRVYCP